MEATKTAGFNWRPRKGMIPSFIVGLIVGPIALSYFGVTVTSRTARANLQENIVELQASVCDAKARATVPEPTKLDSNARRDLATKFAATQSNGYADYEIINLCTNKLGA